MVQLKEMAIVLEMALALRTRGSSCGETMIQKSVYLLKDLTEVPLSYEYVLYRHGPFSFDLRDALSAMRADEMIAVTPQFQFGVSIEPTPFGREILDRFPTTLRRHRQAIAFVADHLANKNVGELERLATALWVTREYRSETAKSRAQLIHEMKPHIPPVDAREAIARVEQLVSEWQ